MNDFTVKNFERGLITRIEAESLKQGSSSDMKNWLHFGDHIELRRGQTRLGSEVAGDGKITGLRVGRRFDGEEVTIQTYDRKVRYYDDALEDWTEVATADVLPADASGEDVAIDTYHSLAGAAFYLSSPRSSIYKIMMPNPDDIVDLQSTDHRGKIKFINNRLRLWDRRDVNEGRDPTGYYGSWLDKDELSDYTEVTAEALGVLGSTVYSGTLAFKGGGSKRTCMYVTIQGTVAAGTETFRDDRNGGLLSNYDSVGTINYATGEYSVTFSDTTTSGVTADYYWEDATSEGPADFSKATPRASGEGFVLRQDDGGSDFQGVGSYGSDEFCFHTIKTWLVNISADDADATNLPYRSKVGISYWRAYKETGDGIYFMDDQDQNDPRVRLLTLDRQNAEVIPVSISDNLDLSDYRFDFAVIEEWNPYILVACRHKDSTANDTVFLYNKIWRNWNRLDYRVSVFAVKGGTLIAGDSASKNVFTLFSDRTDEDVEIPNYWISEKTDLGFSGIKQTNKFKIWGLIEPDQELEIFLSYDGAPFVSVGTIDGDGEYVDSGVLVTVGSSTLGSQEVGGGGDGIEASPYFREMRINTPRYNKVEVKLVANAIGYVSVSGYTFMDNRAKGRSMPDRFVVN